MMNKKQLITFLTLAIFLPLNHANAAQDDPFQDDSFEQDVIEDDMFADETESALAFFGEVQLRQDAVRNLPRPVDNDFDRTMLRVRLGLNWSNEIVNIGLIGKINQSTDDNSDSGRNLDNEFADDESIDSAFVAFNVLGGSQLTLGQAELPLILSESVWDNDLRPRGVSIENTLPIGDYHALRFVLGSFEVNHALDNTAELDAAQVSLFLSEGASTSFTSHLAYLSFSELDDAVRNDIARTNSRSAVGTLAEDFDLIDLQFEVSFSQLSQPLRFGLDLTRNLEADESDAVRFEAVYGSSVDQKGWEVGLASQRVQQDAVLAGFSDDDWWFNTNMRGSSIWFAYGFNESLRLRIAAFSERRDDQPDNNRRGIAELQWSF